MSAGVSAAEQAARPKRDTLDSFYVTLRQREDPLSGHAFRTWNTHGRAFGT
jgi:hypothetical protein